jgi:hypothetical protein
VSWKTATGATWAACVLLVVGAIGPWARGPLAQSVSGLEGGNAGWGLVVLAFAIAVAPVMIRRFPFVAACVIALGGFVCGALALAARSDVTDRAVSSRIDDLLAEIRALGGTPDTLTAVDLERLTSSGWGLNLALVASGLVIAAAFLGATVRAESGATPSRHSVRQRQGWQDPASPSQTAQAPSTPQAARPATGGRARGRSSSIVRTSGIAARRNRCR